MKKRIVLALIISALLTSSATVYAGNETESTDTTPKYVLGDIDSNGKITTTDYLKLRSHFWGSESLKGTAFAMADVNFDGELTVSDYTKIKDSMLGEYDLDDSSWAEYEGKAIIVTSPEEAYEVSTGANTKFVYVHNAEKTEVKEETTDLSKLTAADLKAMANNKLQEAVNNGTIDLDQLKNMKAVDMSQCLKPITVMHKIYNPVSVIGLITDVCTNVQTVDVTTEKGFQAFKDALKMAMVLNCELPKYMYFDYTKYVVFFQKYCNKKSSFIRAFFYFLVYLPAILL